MPARTANARWEGGLKDGKGNMRLGGGAFEGQYSFSSRFEEGAGTNPEERHRNPPGHPASFLRRFRLPYLHETDTRPHRSEKRHVGTENAFGRKTARPPWPTTTGSWPGCTATRRPFASRPASQKDAGLDGRC